MKWRLALALSNYELLFLNSAAAAAKEYSSPAIVSWGSPRIDLFGVTPKGDIWHKYSNTNGWEPHVGVGRLELFTEASAVSAVSTASWGPNRVNFVFIDKSNVVRHKYWTGSEWGPQGGFENLGKGPVNSVKITSWGENRLDIIGLSKNGTLLHKAWTGSGWYPDVQEWEDLGGELVTEPTAISWGAGRLDLFGLTAKGKLAHKYWNGEWQPAGNDWEDLGGVGLKTAPTTSSPQPGRLDIWSVSKTGELNHLYWDGSAWQGWESLGGNFSSTTPQVVHLNPSSIDIIGRNSSSKDKKEYIYKYWDGRAWSEWHNKGGMFASEPVGIRLGSDNLQFIGIEKEGKIVFQIWNGYSWFPGPAAWYEIGDLEAASAGAGAAAAVAVDPGLAVQKPQQNQWDEQDLGIGQEMHNELKLRA